MNSLVGKLVVLLAKLPYRINLTIVRRLHIIVRDDLVYLTVRVFGVRYHRSIKKAGLDTGPRHPRSDFRGTCRTFWKGSHSGSSREVPLKDNPSPTSEIKAFFQYLRITHCKIPIGEKQGNFFSILATSDGAAAASMPTFSNRLDMRFSPPSNVGRASGVCGQEGQGASPVPTVIGTDFSAHKTQRPTSTASAVPPKIPATAGATQT